MNKKVAFLLVTLLISVSLWVSRSRWKGGQDESVSSPDDVDGDDYNVLYIGHSFGRKFAELLEDYAHTAGETDHAQYIEFSGGELVHLACYGKMLSIKRTSKPSLILVKLDVLIMICCSLEFIQTLDTDQAVWNFTDYAAEKNPNIRIGLAMP